jgi:aminoglycoside/choline kinase family phosphotransferase
MVPVTSAAPDARLALLADWLQRDLGLAVDDVRPASADASFRRYFRVHAGMRTLIVMDAPPGREDLGPFIAVARTLGLIGVQVPVVLAEDRARGLLLLSDLGSTHYLAALAAGADAERLYADATETLVRIQAGGADASLRLPPYDAAFLAREIRLFPEWFLERHLGIAVDAAVEALVADVSARLVAAAVEQPQVFVHRDYHSRNLMVTPERNPGVLDFQDAMRGPIAYDLVSLLKDCYVVWPRERVLDWLRGYRRRARAAGLAVGAHEAEFLRWFDLVGLQRHLKVLGIFARLWYRDGKPGYLADLPAVLAYVRGTAAAYPEFDGLARFLDEVVAPRFAAVEHARVAG